MKVSLGRRENTIAPDLVTGHLNSVLDASPRRLNLRDVERSGGSSRTPGACQKILSTSSLHLSSIAYAKPYKESRLAAATAETVFLPWIRAVFLCDLDLARWAPVLNSDLEKFKGSRCAKNVKFSRTKPA